MLLSKNPFNFIILCQSKLIVRLEWYQWTIESLVSLHPALCLYLGDQLCYPCAPKIGIKVVIYGILNLVGYFSETHNQVFYVAHNRV